MNTEYPECRAAADTLSTFLDKLIKTMLGFCSKRTQQDRFMHEVDSYGGGHQGCSKFFSTFELNDVSAELAAVHVLEDTAEQMDLFSVEMSNLSELLTKLEMAHSHPQAYRISFQVACYNKFETTQTLCS